MPYDLSKLNGEYQERFIGGTIKKGQESVNTISEKSFEILNNSFDTAEMLGIEIGEDGKIPVANGIPRIFIMKTGEDGMDRMQSLEDANIQFKSREFWQEAQLGNVFAFPAGSDKAVQIQPDIRKARKPAVSASSPVELSKVQLGKKDHEYREPNWFTRMVNRMFSGYRKTDCEIYREREKLNALSGKRAASIKTEQEEIKDINARSAKRIEKAAEKTLLDEVSSKGSMKPLGKQFYKDLTAPQPKFYPQFESKPDRGNFYTKEDFNSLKPIDKNIEDYSVGGKAVSADEYCGLVMTCSHDEKYAMDGFKISQGYDDTYKQTLMNMGCSEKEANKRITMTYSTFISDDIMKGDLRVGQGSHIKTNVQPAREQSFEILEQYKQGNKAPLAEKIAEGIKLSVNTSSEIEYRPGYGAYNRMEFAAALGDMLERDPELKALAKEKGLKDKDIDVAKGMREFSKADTLRHEAKNAIAKAAFEDRELSYQEKLKYTKDILAAEIMETRLTTENKTRETGGPAAAAAEQAERTAAAVKDKLIVTKEQLQNWSENPGTRPLPPKGKMYADQVTKYMESRKQDFNVHPKTLSEAANPENIKNYKVLAEGIIEKDGLAMLSTKDLSRTINVSDTVYKGANLFKKADAVAQSIEAQKQHEAKGPAAENEPGVEKRDPQNTTVDYGKGQKENVQASAPQL